MLRWRVLFAALTAAVSVYHLARLVVDGMGLVDPVLGHGEFAIGAIGIVGLALTVPLIRGCNWARIALIGLVGSFALLLGVLVPYAAWQTEWNYTRMTDLSSAVLCLVIAALVVSALMHPDVRRDFERQ